MALWLYRTSLEVFLTGKGLLEAGLRGALGVDNRHLDLVAMPQYFYQRFHNLEQFCKLSSSNFYMILELY